MKIQNLRQVGHSNLKRHAYKNYGLSRKPYSQLKYPNEYQISFWRQ